jgi:hypothetical protein
MTQLTNKLKRIRQGLQVILFSLHSSPFPLLPRCFLESTSNYPENTMAEKADNDVVKNPESASDEEKTGVAHTQRAGAVSHAYAGDLPPDPDAHLSPEERAAIVSSSPCNFSNAR